MKTKKEFKADVELSKKFNNDYVAYANSFDEAEAEGDNKKNVVSHFMPEVLHRANKTRASFLNRSISFPVASVVVNSLFISNKEKAAGKTVADADKVFVSMTFTDDKGNKLDVNDDFDTAKGEFEKAGKTLITAEGVSGEIQAGINEGVYNVVA
jgi:hypothetical protein